jgi:sec-independent protein translocase protein TatA
MVKTSTRTPQPRAAAAARRIFLVAGATMSSASWGRSEHLPGTHLGAEESGGLTVAGLGAPELMIVLAVVLVLFGGAKLPKLARSLGEAKREFEHSRDDEAVPTA